MFGQLFRNIPEVVKNLLIINVLFFVAQSVVPAIDANLSLYSIVSEQFKPWQLATHFFMHGNLMHLFFNMFALVIFGSQLERVWDPKRFLIYYLACAMGAAVIYSAWSYLEINTMQSIINDFSNNPSINSFEYFKSKYIDIDIFNIETQSKIRQSLNEITSLLSNPVLLDYGKQEAISLMKEFYSLKVNTPMVGASGAVFGLLAAFGYLFPNTQLMLLFPPIPIKAKFFVIGYAALELYLGTANHPGDNVAHFAHLGGALIGILLVLYWNKNRNSFF